MKRYLFIFCLFAGLCTMAQTRPIVTGHIEAMYSGILKENREIWVHVPDPLPTDFAVEHYPVVYLLDGDANFPAVQAFLQQYGDGTSFPKMILVGVVNTNRFRDLTPTAFPGGPRNAGGGEKFLSFMEKELIPHIDSLYPTAPYRILIGHSLGGLMAVHSLFNGPGVFNAYIAIDPSLFWDDQKLLKQAKEQSLQPAKPTVLYLAVANTLEKGMDTSSVQKDTSSDLNNLHIRTNLGFAHLLEPQQSKLLWFHWKYYPDYDHGAVTPVAAYDGLRYIFKDYNLHYGHDTFEDPSNHPSDTLISSHYRMIGRQMGYKISPPEMFIDAIAQTLLNTGQADRAAYYFQMNAENYPLSFHASAALGDYYSTKKNKSKAIAWYEKALALKNTAPIREKLKNVTLVQ